MIGLLRASAGALMLGMLCNACGALPPLPEVSSAPAPRQLETRRIIVTLPDATPEEWQDVSRALQAQYDLRQAGEFPLASIGVNCYVFEIPDERAIGAVIAQLERDPRIDLVQRNQVFQAQVAPQQGPTPEYEGLQYALQAIHADEAHRQSTGRGVKVAVVDTGVDSDHPDLRDRVIASENFVQDGEKTFKEDYHGTAVAGIIAARADDGAGIAGVAPDVELMALKACWPPSPGSARALCSSWSLAKAVDHALRNGANAINLSLTGPVDPLLMRLLRAAAAQRVTVIAAALENDREGPGFPASFESVLAVVASDAEGRVTMPAWLAAKLPIAAPGIDILTPVPPTRYDFQSGSSLAAAHATGVVALMLQKNMQLDPAEVFNRLNRSAIRSSSSQIGIVDAEAALNQ